MAPEHPVLITPNARAQLRGLPQDAQDRAERLIRRLRDDRRAVSKKLAGGSGAWRARLKTSRVRIGWAPEPGSGAVVFYIGLRDERTYADLFRRALGDHAAAAAPFEDDADDDVLVELHADTTHLPAYVLPAAWDLSSWQALVFGDSVLSPRLTADQADDFLRLLWESGPAADRCTVVQGGAGSGKSVCALLWAASLRADAAGLGKHHVAYLAPAGLTRRLRQFDEVQQHLAPPEDHVLTAQAWFRSLLPDSLRATHTGPQSAPAPGQDADVREDATLAAANALRADALQAALRRAAFSGKTAGRATRLPNVSADDVLLYEALVLGDGPHKDGAAHEHAARAKTLAAADPAVWADELVARGISSRTQLALDVQAHARPHPPLRAPRVGDPRVPALIVVDEAQDLLVEELRAVYSVWRRWNDAGHETRLWLFGDLNQRITPSGFTWDRLASMAGLEPKKRTLTKNYRNTAAVLALAARVLDHGQANARAGKHRHLPQSPPESAGTDASDTDAERVRVVRVGTPDDARRFVAAMTPDGRSSYFRASQARKAQVLSPVPIADLENAIVNVPTAIKGSELEAAVAVGLFEPLMHAPDSVQETNVCYTLVTRVRSRLLLALTDDEHRWATTAGLLGGVEDVEAAEAARWVAELASKVDLHTDTESTFDAFVLPSLDGGPWFDAWEVLVEMGATAKAATWVERASPSWTTVGLEAAAAGPALWVRVVALSALGRLDEAERATVAFAATAVDPDDVFAAEAQRLFNHLADQLEVAGRPYEAHRLLTRRKAGYRPPPGMPFPDLDPHLPLGRALFRAVASHLQAADAQTHDS